MDLNVKGETINLLEDSTGENICDFGQAWIFEGMKSVNHKEKD